MVHTAMIRRGPINHPDLISVYHRHALKCHTEPHKYVQYRKLIKTTLIHLRQEYLRLIIIYHIHLMNYHHIP